MLVAGIVVAPQSSTTKGFVPTNLFGNSRMVNQRRRTDALDDFRNFVSAMAAWGS
jgi:hypothetical protein